MQHTCSWTIFRMIEYIFHDYYHPMYFWGCYANIWELIPLFTPSHHMGKCLLVDVTCITDIFYISVITYYYYNCDCRFEGKFSFKSKSHTRHTRRTSKRTSNSLQKKSFSYFSPEISEHSSD